MADTPDRIERKVLKEKKTISGVKYPPLFALEREGKISYLLGTLHIEPLESLPKVCYDIFDKCTFYVTEEIEHSDEDIAQFYLKSVVRSASSKPWVHQLPPHVATFLEERIAVYYGQHHESIHKTIHQLKIWAAYQFAENGHIILISREEDNEKKELAEGEELTGMDNALLKHFGAKNGGLESKFDKIPGYKIVGNTIEDLKRLYTAMTSEPEKNTEDEDEDRTLSSIIQSYRLGRDFYDPYNVLEETNDIVTVSRTIRWLPNIIKHHYNPDENVLFGVGLMHLIGEYGLLSLLPKLGFSISQLTINGTFEPYVYPFNSEVIARRALAQELRMSSCVEQSDRQMILHQYTGLAASKPIQIIDSFITGLAADSEPNQDTKTWTKNRFC